MLIPLVTDLSPNTAVLAGTAGLSLIAVELNRPGLILPGACGLLLALLATAALLTRNPQIWAMALLILATAALLVQLRRAVPLWIAALASASLFAGFFWLLPSGSRIHPIIAAVCAVLLGCGTTMLTRIGRRARVNKGLD